MKILSIITTLLILSGLSLYTVRNIMTGEKINWAEGQRQISPNNKWVVCIKSNATSISEESYCKVIIFDTAQYPNLKSGQFPTTAQENNPKASYLLPIQFYARETNLEWAPDSSYVVLKQVSINAIPPLAYTIDFKTFSLNKTEF